MSQCPGTPCPRSKAATGCLLYPAMNSLRTCHHQYCLFEANLNAEKGDFYIGNCSPLPGSAEAQSYASYSDPFTSNCPEVMPVMSTSGKKTPASMEPSLNWEDAPLAEEDLLIGTPFEHKLFKETLLKYPATYMFGVTTNCEGLAKTTYNRLLWSELVMCTGVVLGLGNREEPGKKLDYMLTLRIRDPNSGMVTKVMNMLSSMSFEGASTSLTCSSGLIVIRSLWKLKDPVQCCELHQFGSLQM